MNDKVLSVKRLYILAKQFFWGSQDTKLQTWKATKLQIGCFTSEDKNKCPPQALHTIFALVHCGTVTLWIVCQKEEYLQPRYFNRIMVDKAFFNRL